MKHLAFLLSFISMITFAQTDVEDQSPESMVSLDTAQNIMTYDVQGVYQLAEKTCSRETNQFLSSRYQAGELVFVQDLKKRINQYLNSDAYAAEGHFYIDVTITKNGDYGTIKVGPNVNNTRYFYDDLRSAVKKVKGKWFPASCNGTAIDSKIRIKLLFDSLIIDSSN